MRFHTLLHLLFVWLVSSSSLLAAGASSDPSAGVEGIRRLFDHLGKNDLFSGTVLVAKDDRVLYHEAFGYANREWEIRNTTDTRFQIGSISKQFTAVLLLQLAAEGRLSLTDPVGDHLPELEKPWVGQVTLHHLLSQTSGVPNYSLLEDYDKTIGKQRFTREEFLDLLITDGILDTLAFEPGSEFRYSNTNYFLAGIVAERVAGVPVEDLYRQRIFLPLGMNDSGIFDDTRLLPKRAWGYEQGPNGGYEPIIAFAVSPKSVPSGGLFSTAEDLFRLYKGIRDRRLLDDRWSEKFLTPQHQIDETVGYAYGNYTVEYPLDSTRSIRIVEHGGSTPGTSTQFLQIHDLDLCIVLLHNGGMGRETMLSTVAYAMLEGIEGKEIEIPRFGLLGALAYTTIMKDGQAIRDHYRFLKENRRDVYLFDSGQLSLIGNLTIQLLGDADKAETLFLLNRDEHPDEALVHVDLGRLYLNKGDSTRALEHLRHARSLDPEDEELAELTRQAGGQ